MFIKEPNLTLISGGTTLGLDPGPIFPHLNAPQNIIPVPVARFL